MSDRKVCVLDVRDDLSRGREPFGKIMQAVSKLPEKQDLVLVAPFEPVPLYHVLEAQGFSHEASKTDSGDFQIRFTRQALDSRPVSVQQTPNIKHQPPSPGRRAASCAGQSSVEVDVRGLEPPQPLVKILEAVAALPAGSRLRALTDRRPMHLYAQLAERGFAARTEQQANGTFVTEISRP
jgi:uncharacterized protein (DUF2249 family)